MSDCHLEDEPKSRKGKQQSREDGEAFFPCRVVVERKIAKEKHIQDWYCMN